MAPGGTVLVVPLLHTVQRYGMSCGLRHKFCFAVYFFIAIRVIHNEFARRIGL